MGKGVRLGIDIELKERTVLRPITFIIHKDEDKNGYWAECKELQTIFTQADTIQELYKNIDDALDCYLYDK